MITQRHWLHNSYKCGCEVREDSGGACYIEYCTKHEAAPAMYEALKAWMKYAGTDYSGDGMDAVTMSKMALSQIEKEVSK